MDGKPGCKAVLIPVPSVKVDAMDGKFVYTDWMDGKRVQIGSDSRPFVLNGHVDGNPGALGYRCTKTI